jgi:hypothetical protein
VLYSIYIKSEIVEWFVVMKRKYMNVSDYRHTEASSLAWL